MVKKPVTVLPMFVKSLFQTGNRVLWIVLTLLFVGLSCTADAFDMGTPALKVPLIAPVSGMISSPFGWRSDPMNGGSRFHSGVDLAAAQGTPIIVPQNGIVVFAGNYGGYGNVVVVDHGYSLYTLYGHTSSYTVHPGQTVSQGQVIAFVGSTGRSTGPHLHFEVHQHGQYVDPMNYLAYLSNKIYSNGLAGNPRPYNAQPVYAQLSIAGANKKAPLQISADNSGHSVAVKTDNDSLTAKSVTTDSQHAPQVNESPAASAATPTVSSNSSPAIRIESSHAMPTVDIATEPVLASTTSTRKAKHSGVELVQGNKMSLVKF